MNIAFRKIILLLGDAFLLLVSLWITLLIGFWGEWDIGLFVSHAAQFSLLYIFWLIIFYISDLYDLSVPVTSLPFFSRYVISILILFATGVLYFYFLSFTSITPKTNLLIHVVLFGLASYSWRVFFASKLSSIARWRIGLFGIGSELDDLEHAILSYKHHGYECVRLGNDIEYLAVQIRDQKLQTVVVPSSFLTQTNYIQALYDCLETGVLFIDLPQAFEIFSRCIPLDVVDQQWFIRNIQDKQHGLNRYFKRGFDVVAALMILLCTFPLWVLSALAIKIEDRGNIFYTQERLGLHRATFKIRKFRSMRKDAEESGAQWATKDDPRVTRVGRILRRTHLDEIPQMLNVLRGDLSLVGPRPERSVFVEQLEREIPHYRVRHFIKPGFTGWAQIKFRYARSVLDSKRKFEYDLYYIKNRSFILDVLILLKTVQLFFRRDQ